jgi:predicted MFS family arabinose efflux permease
MMTAEPRRALWAQIALGLGSVIQILGMPIIVGGLQDHWGYSAELAGNITSIDLAGLCVGGIMTSAWANRIDWRRYMAIVVIAGALMNVSCVWFHTLGPLCALRFAAGLASGAAYSSSLALLCQTEDTAKGFSVLIFAQVIANVIVLAAFPAIDNRWGPAGLFVSIAVVLSATVFVVPALPARRPPTAGAPTTHEIATPLRVTAIVQAGFCLAAVALVYIAIGSYWAYAERMGISFGLPPTIVHNLLTASVLLSTIGCVAAFRISRSVGQSRPLLAALGVLSVTLLANSVSPHAVMYILTLGAMQLCWNFIDIFQLGTLASVDPSGRGAALVPAAQGVALAIGPAAGGQALTVGQGYAAVLVFSGSAATLAALCFAVVYVWHRRTTPAMLRAGF